MKKTSIDEARQSVSSAKSTRIGLSKDLGTTDFGMYFYKLGPGDAFSGIYHTHQDQEEVFFIMSGTTTFESEAGKVTVDAGEAIRFAPGEFQRGYNSGEDMVTALALGAPGAKHSYEQLEAYIDCSECGERTHQDVARVRDGPSDFLLMTCKICEAETRVENRIE